MKNLFVFGLDAFNRAQLESLRDAARYRFHSLVDYAALRSGAEISVRSALGTAREQLQRFTGSVDGIVGYWDFPVSTALPILRSERGLPGPTLDSVLKCEHKYWSRCEQARVVPEVTPRFCAVNPFGEDPPAQIDLAFPFWLKPVKAASSWLAFLVRNRAELDHALNVIRARIARFAEPFNFIAAHTRLPLDIAAIDGYYCIAEEVISAGKQCTLEGYVHRGKTVIYGTVDSIREGRHRSCFGRYQYPSRFPRRVRERMEQLTARLMGHIEFDNGPFNIEYYWDPSDDRLRLLEINPRISKSHCPLFHMVDGEYHHAVNVHLALGERPVFPRGEGRYRCAGKFMVRRYRDERVDRVPGPEHIGRVQAAFPEATVQVHVRPGMRLSELAYQDSYSYEIAVVFLGAATQKELLKKYRKCLSMLPFQFSPVSESKLVVPGGAG